MRRREASTERAGDRAENVRPRPLGRCSRPTRKIREFSDANVAFGFPFNGEGGKMSDDLMEEVRRGRPDLPTIVMR